MADIARRQGIQHLVYASVGSAHRRTGIPHFENKARVEERVRSLGFPSHTILRPVFFMENWAGPWFLPGLEQGQLAIGLDPKTRMQMIATPDIGKYARWAFENHAALNGRGIALAGDEMTMPEVAEVLGRAMGRPVSFVRVPIEQVRSFSADFATRSARLPGCETGLLRLFDVRWSTAACLQRSSNENAGAFVKRHS